MPRASKSGVKELPRLRIRSGWDQLLPPSVVRHLVALLADNHRQVHDNLSQLIAALEDIGDTTP